MIHPTTATIDLSSELAHMGEQSWFLLICTRQLLLHHFQNSGDPCDFARELERGAKGWEIEWKIQLVLIMWQCSFELHYLLLIILLLLLSICFSDFQGLSSPPRHDWMANDAEKGYIRCNWLLEQLMRWRMDWEEFKFFENNLYKEEIANKNGHLLI